MDGQWKDLSRGADAALPHRKFSRPSDAEMANLSCNSVPLIAPATTNQNRESPDRDIRRQHKTIAGRLDGLSLPKISSEGEFEQLQN
jgi:hypothetical protein